MPCYSEFNFKNFQITHTVTLCFFCKLNNAKMTTAPLHINATIHCLNQIIHENECTRAKKHKITMMPCIGRASSSDMVWVECLNTETHARQCADTQNTPVSAASPTTSAHQPSTAYNIHTQTASLTYSISTVMTSTHLTHTQPFSGPLSRNTRVSRYQKDKTNLDLTKARDSEWQWHQLGRMQVCASLQTDNHASTPPLSFLQAGCPSCRPTNSVKALKKFKS